MWSIIFVRKWQALNFARSLALPCGVTDTAVRAWNLELHDDTELSAMMKNLAHPERVRVDRFLMESIVFEYIEAQSKKELTEPTKMVMEKYMLAWSLRPRCAANETHLEHLCKSQHARKTWCRGFRKRWSLTWGSRVPSHDVTQAELKK
jgi:hypothetical protein